MGKAEDAKAKAKMVEAKYGKTLGASKGSKPAPKAKVSARPMGGLKPHGIKAKWEKKF